MIGFITGALCASLVLTGLSLHARDRWARHHRPRLVPGEHVVFYSPEDHRLPLAVMVVESYDRCLGGPSTMSLVDWSTFVSRNSIPLHERNPR